MNTQIGWFFDKQGNVRAVYAPTYENGTEVLPDGITHTGQIAKNTGVGGTPSRGTIKKMSTKKRAA